MERWTVLFLCGSLTLAAPGQAQEPPSTAESAAQLLEEGLRLRQDGRDQDAANRFRRAYELDRSPRALAQLALAEQALGRWIDAEAHLTGSLSHETDPWILSHRQVLEGALETIRTNVGRLAVASNADGAAVSVNGRPVGVTPLAPVTVEIGTAVVEITGVGYVPIQRTVSVQPGSLTRVSVDLVPLERETDAARVAHSARSSADRPPSPRTTTDRGQPSPLLWTGVAAAAAAVAALAGTLVAVGARESEVQVWNDDSVCPPTLPMGRLTMCADVYATWRTAEDWAIAGAVTTGILALAGAVLIALGVTDEAESSDAMALRLDGRGLRLTW